MRPRYAIVMKGLDSAVDASRSTGPVCNRTFRGALSSTISSRSHSASGANMFSISRPGHVSSRSPRLHFRPAEIFSAALWGGISQRSVKIESRLISWASIRGSFPSLKEKQ